jgi:hypothetical protein
MNETPELARLPIYTMIHLHSASFLGGNWLDEETA